MAPVRASQPPRWPQSGRSCRAKRLKPRTGAAGCTTRGTPRCAPARRLWRRCWRRWTPASARSRRMIATKRATCNTICWPVCRAKRCTPQRSTWRQELEQDAALDRVKAARAQGSEPMQAALSQMHAPFARLLAVPAGRGRGKSRCVWPCDNMVAVHGSCHAIKPSYHSHRAGAHSADIQIPDACPVQFAANGDTEAAPRSASGEHTDSAAVPNDRRARSRSARRRSRAVASLYQRTTAREHEMPAHAGRSVHGETRFGAPPLVPLLGARRVPTGHGPKCWWRSLRRWARQRRWRRRRTASRCLRSRRWRQAPLANTGARRFSTSTSAAQTLPHVKGL